MIFTENACFTGPYAVRRLHALGHEITVFHRGEHEAELPADVHHVHGDFAHPPRELPDFAPEVVVHMMAMTEADAESFQSGYSSGRHCYGTGMLQSGWASHFPVTLSWHNPFRVSDQTALKRNYTTASVRILGMNRGNILLWHAYIAI